MPERIQLRRTKGWRKPEGAVMVARPSKWGNPWAVDPERTTSPPSNQYRSTAAECVRLYRDWVACEVRFTLDDIRNELGGHDLACWCPLDQPCHADVLLELANYEEPRRLCDPLPDDQDPPEPERTLADPEPR